jgi:hypothetical protein
MKETCLMGKIFILPSNKFHKQILNITLELNPKIIWGPPMNEGGGL